MAYQIYTPMQAPTIPASIFSGAMERGAKAGTMLDTPETAKLKGEIAGRTLNLQEQQMRENIETSNIQQESALIQQQRQQEALKADKRANKMAPIKDALGIAGGVLDIISGVQGVMQNANVLELQENQVKLDQIKTETQMQTATITQATAMTVAENGLAEATRAADDMKVTRAISTALSKGDTESLNTVLQQASTQDYLMRNPQQAASTYTSLYNMGGISKAELDSKLAVAYSQYYYQGQSRLQTAQAKAKQKAADELEANYEALDPLITVLNRVNPDADATDPEYLSKLDIVPADLYTVKDGKIDPTSKPPAVVSSSGGHLVINRETNEVVTELEDKGAEYSKLLAKHKYSYKAFSEGQQAKLDKGNLVKTSSGTITRKTEQPAPNIPLPDAGLASAKQKLSAYGVSPAKAETSGQEAGRAAANAPWYDPRKWTESIKATVNDIAPWAIDNLPKDAMNDADSAAAATAKSTLSQYQKAGPKGKRAMVAKVAQMTGGAGFDKSHYYKGDDVEGETLEGMYFQGEAPGEQGDAEPLTRLFKREIVNSMETVREAGRKRGLDTSQPTESEYKQSRLVAAAGTAATVTGAAKVVEDYNRITGRTPYSEKGQAPVTPQKVSQVVASRQRLNNWSNAKAAGVETVVNRIESVPSFSSQPPYVKAILAVESSGGADPNVSWDRGERNIIGSMQMGWRAEIDAKNFLGNQDLDRSVPEDNVALGKAYIDKLLIDYNYDKKLAYGAYNAGPGIINDAIKLSGGKETWEEILPYILPALEAKYQSGNTSDTPLDKFLKVRNYPNKVLEYEQIFNQLA